MRQQAHVRPLFKISYIRIMAQIISITILIVDGHIADGQGVVIADRDRLCRSVEHLRSQRSVQDDIAARFYAYNEVLECARCLYS